MRFQITKIAFFKLSWGGAGFNYCKRNYGVAKGEFTYGVGANKKKVGHILKFKAHIFSLLREGVKTIPKKTDK